MHSRLWPRIVTSPFFTAHHRPQCSGDFSEPSESPFARPDPDAVTHARNARQSCFRPSQWGIVAVAAYVDSPRFFGRPTSKAYLFACLTYVRVPGEACTDCS